MSRKIVTGAVIALAAGLAAFIYKRNKSKINEAAEDAYDDFSDGIEFAESKTENLFS